MDLYCKLRVAITLLLVISSQAIISLDKRGDPNDTVSYSSSVGSIFPPAGETSS